MRVSVVPLIALIAAFVAAVMPSRARNRAAGVAGAAAVIGLVLVSFRFVEVRDGDLVLEEIPWVPSLGLDLVFRLDGLSWAFSVLILGIGALVMLYARYYLSPPDSVPRFFAFLLAFMGAMLGVALSGNLLGLAFFWELTSLFSFLLIGYWHQRAEARRGARIALTVTAMGGLSLLAGLLLLGHMAGSFDLGVVLQRGERVRTHALYPACLSLILFGAFTKSAQFPFQFWLPNAMAAPTPVSAYLHSATLVNLGVFLLARLWSVLSGTELWFWLVSSAGLASLLIGAWAAFFQRDLKGLLAYSTVSHLGLMMLLLGLNSPLAAVAAMFHLMNHATFKASLFMAVGIIDHETGTRDIKRLSGLFRWMPITSTLALVATAAMAGVPLLNGFLSKEMFFAETVFLDAIPLVEWGLPILATIAGMGSVAYSLRFAVEVFFGPERALATPRMPEEPPTWMRVPVEVLVVACLVVGIAPATSIGPVLAAASREVVGGPLPAYSLKLWHGLTPPLLMSTLALAGGAVLYVLHRRRETSQAGREIQRSFSLDGAKAFASVLAWLTVSCRWMHRRWLMAGLQRQLMAVVLVALLVGGWTLREGIGRGDRALVPLSPVLVALWGVGGVAAVATAAMAKFERLAALMLAGVAGAVTCVTFIWFSAPDLALTQLTVEIMMTMLLLLGLRWLPRREPNVGVYNPRTKRSAIVRRTRDLVVALAAGVGTAVLAYAVMTRDLPERTSFFLERALTDGGGRNVVNVMLVDFRGFDTFGEGVVLALAALAVYALLRRFRPAVEVSAMPQQQRVTFELGKTDLSNAEGENRDAPAYLVAPTVLARLLLPISGVVAVFFFLRGHNAPGGGFVAGLVMAVGLLLQYVVSGTDWVEDRVRIAPRSLIGIGLLLVVGTAGGSIVFGQPLLTSSTLHLSLPMIGDVHLGSVLLFDAGVFCIVVGAAMLILVALAHQSMRARRAPRGG
jgi:multicomponent K+:H+ antiporter subunit A